MQHAGACKPLRVDRQAAEASCQGQPKGVDGVTDACRQARLKVWSDAKALKEQGAPLPARGGLN
jgi:hypothetical protein